MTAMAAPRQFLSKSSRTLLAERGEMRSSADTPLINLGQGTPDLPTAPHIIAAVRRHLDEHPWVPYSPYDGLPALRQAIAAKLKRDNGLDYDPDAEIMVTNGSQEAVWIAMQLLADPGDEFLIGDPHYTVYDDVAGLLGGKMTPVPSIVGQGFQYDLEAMELAITPRTKAIVLVSPDNPTGAVQTPATVQGIAAMAARHNLAVISDELYERFLFDGAIHTSIATLPEMRARTLTIGGCSKAYAMTGWRVGYLAYPAAFRAAALRAKHSLSICTAVPSQIAAQAALAGPPAMLAGMLAEWADRRTFLFARLSELGIPIVRTPGAYYALVDIRASGLSSPAFARRLAAAEGVRVSPGSAFGAAGEGFVRVSFMTPRPALDQALTRLGRFLSTVSPT